MHLAAEIGLAISLSLYQKEIQKTLQQNRQLFQQPNL